MTIPSSILFQAFRDLLLALALGILIGFEREMAKKEAGVRTFGMISFGSALFVIIVRIAMVLYENVGIPVSAIYNPVMTIGQIILGMGFLGAGIIVFEQRERSVKGLTTAAIMWTTSAIGGAIGLELYSLAIFAAVVIFLFNALVLPIERKIDEKQDKHKENLE